MTTSVYAFNENGELYKKSEDGGPGSQYYTDRIDAAIKSPNTITIDIRQTLTHKDKETGTMVTDDIDTRWNGGVTAQYDDGDSTVYITGHSSFLTDKDGQTTRYYPGEILMHELIGHAIPNSVGSDTGNAIDNDNKARAELGISLRPKNPEHTE